MPDITGLLGNIFNAGDPNALYGGLLGMTPEQQQAAARAVNFRGLMAAAGAAGDAAMPTRMPTPLGAVLGKMGAAMGTGEDAAVDARVKAMQGQLYGAQAQAALAKLDYYKRIMGGDVSGLLGDGSTSGSGLPGVATPGVTAPTAPGAGGGGGSSGTAAPLTDGVTPASSSNPEIATNNFAGMRNPNVKAAGGPSANPQGWQQFATPEEGIAGISHQLDRYYSGATTGTPLTTVRQIVSTWAPPNENQTDALINRAATVMGVNPDAPLDLTNPSVKAKLVEAMIRGEQGGNLPDIAGNAIAKVYPNANWSPYNSRAQPTQTAAGTPGTPAPAPSGAGPVGGLLNLPDPSGRAAMLATAPPPAAAMPQAAVPSLPPAAAAPGPNASAAAPPGAIAGLLSRLNPIPSAQAAEMPPAGAAAALPPGVAPGQPYGTAQLAPRPPPAAAPSPNLTQGTLPPIPSPLVTPPGPGGPSGGGLLGPNAGLPQPNIPPLPPAAVAPPSAPQGGPPLPPPMMRAPVPAPQMAMPGGGAAVQPGGPIAGAPTPQQVALARRMALGGALLGETVPDFINKTAGFPLVGPTAAAAAQAEEPSKIREAQAGPAETGRQQRLTDAYKFANEPRWVDGVGLVQPGRMPGFSLSDTENRLPVQPGNPNSGYGGMPSAAGGAPSGAAPSGIPGSTVPGATPGFAPGGGVILPAQSDAQKQLFDDAVKATRNDLNTYHTERAAAPEQIGLANQITDLLGKAQLGWGADTKNQAAMVMRTLGVPEDTISQFNNTQASSLLTKMFLQQSASAVRAMGAREPGSVISLFSRTYPSIESDPEAARVMVNALRMQAQWKLDRANAADTWADNQRANAGAYGENYRGLTGFDQNFLNSNNPEDYWRAAVAMSATPGQRPQSRSLEQSIAWPGGKPTEPEAGRIYALIPPGATFVASDGQLYTKPRQ